jgi:hypothetical protein
VIQQLTVHRIDCDARRCRTSIVSFGGATDATIEAHNDGWLVLQHLDPTMHFCPQHRDEGPA